MTTEKKEQVKTALFETLGLVSMCWSESTRAREAGDAVWTKIEELTSTKNAVAKLCEELRSDEGLYTAYQANIAMAFQDEYTRKIKMSKAVNIHEISNNAAKNFLDLLIKEPNGDTENQY